ncbi:MAG TPA: hypothetical protein VGA04_22710 [Streptosporangiaceae bacterium]
MIGHSMVGQCGFGPATLDELHMGQIQRGQRRGDVTLPAQRDLPQQESRAVVRVKRHGLAFRQLRQRGEHLGEVATAMAGSVGRSLRR